MGARGEQQVTNQSAASKPQPTVKMEVGEEKGAIECQDPVKGVEGDKVVAMETEEGVNGRENPENEIKVEVVEKTGEVEENGDEMEVSESGDENITAARIKVEVKTNEEEASEKVTPNEEVSIHKETN